MAGILHDLGKATERFQRYLQGIGEAGGDHKSAGVLYGRDQGVSLPGLLAIAGHHGGLPSLAELKGRAQETLPTEVAAAARQLYTALPLPHAPAPAWLPPKNPLEAELFTRLLFSALVDADFLDTEAHFHPEPTALRGQYPPLAPLGPAFEAQYQARFAEAVPTPVNQTRQQVYAACLQAAAGPPGAYSLTVPTGGGKTLASLAFALRHALTRSLRRVIVVIPYTSIIEQTADVYRQYLPAEAVIEHHSAVALDGPEESRQRRELAAENWDAPLVVTTAVQFFESLFANSPSRCRKLHNIARSVVIVDEVQSLPVGLLKPTFEVVASLVRHYGVTCLLTTATQPAYERFTSLPITEIIPDPPALARQLRRVRFVRLQEPLSWAEVGQRMGATGQAMAVVNTRADARALYGALPEAGRLYLSTNLCGAHRRQVLQEVRRRLEQGEPCLLATTQLVEAGVDLDFPMVFRAMGPLVSIVQAAGRCNREGKHESGDVFLFTPAEGHLPPRAYRTATDQTGVFLQAEPQADLGDPETHCRFFAGLYQASELDAKGISALRGALDFPAVARAYRLIDDDSTPVAVPWGDGQAALNAIERQGYVTRDDYRQLQPYFVNLRRYELQRAQEAHLCREVIRGSGLLRWEGRYDDDLGLQWEFDTLPF